MHSITIQNVVLCRQYQINNISVLMETQASQCC